MDAVLARPTVGGIGGPRPAHRPDPPDGNRANATLVGREPVSDTILRLRVRPDGGVPIFHPGQYVAIGLEVDGRPILRPYSMASTPDDDALELLVRLVPDGSLTPRLWDLRAGDRLAVGRPKGLFALDQDDPRRPVLVATGTGIAPLLSMLEARLASAAAEGPVGRRAPTSPTPIVVHGVARVADLAYRERLEALGAAGRIVYAPAISRPDDPANACWAGRTGRVGTILAGLLDALGAHPRRTVALVCGNPGMAGSVGDVLRGWGLPAEAIRTEAYWVPTAG